MRAFTILAASTLLLASTPSASDAVGENPAAVAAHVTLNGWQKFTFGMSEDEARAIPGLSWKRGIDTPLVHVMTSLPMTSEWGPDTTVGLGFDAEKKLHTISLYLENGQSVEDCKKAFLGMLASASAKYGAFSPSGEKNDWFVIGDTLNRRSLLERTSSLKLPGTQTKYWWRTFLPNVAGLNVEAQANLAQGFRSITVEMFQKDGPNGCHRDTHLQENAPSKEQLQRQAKLKNVPTDLNWRWARIDRWLKNPAQYSTGVAENVKVAHGLFSADLKTATAGGHNNVSHLIGTVSNFKITAHVISSQVASDDFPTSFNGYITILPINSDPVDVFEIGLTGKARWVSTKLALAAYHQDKPHTPTQVACSEIAQDAYRSRRSTREMTYRGLLKVLGCPT